MPSVIVDLPAPFCPTSAAAVTSLKSISSFSKARMLREEDSGSCRHPAFQLTRRQHEPRQAELYCSSQMPHPEQLLGRLGFRDGLRPHSSLTGDLLLDS